MVEVDREQSRVQLEEVRDPLQLCNSARVVPIGQYQTVPASVTISLPLLERFEEQEIAGFSA